MTVKPESSSRVQMSVCSCVIGVALVAGASTLLHGGAAATAVACVTSLVPALTVMAASWNGVISESWAKRQANWLGGGIGPYIFAAAAATASGGGSRVGASVLMVASVYMPAVTRAPWRRPSVDRLWLAAAVAGASIAGIYADGIALGWNFVIYGVFAASAHVSLLATTQEVVTS